jgi:ketosteroid isomerase-like protein
MPGHIAVPNLIGLYAEAIDAGDFHGVADLLANAVITTEGTDTKVEGREAILAMYEQWTRRYDDNGTPHTKHVTTNLILDVDESEGTASARSYFTVLQATDELPLQPIITGRYRDTFTRVDGVWRFTTRHMVTDYTGDLSHHLLIPLA